MKKVIQIDANGMFVSDIWLDDNEATPIDCVETLAQDGFIHPKWDGTQWVEGGQLVLADVQDRKKAELNQACNTTLLGGFPSSALGVQHIYPSDEEAQRNLQGAIVDTLIDPTVTATGFKTSDAGYLDHTPDQLKQVGKDWKVFLQANLGKYQQLKADVNGATTPADVKAIVW